jgi:hypothetical protein
MNKGSVKYVQGIHFSQLTLAEKTDIETLGRTALYLLIC